MQVTTYTHAEHANPRVCDTAMKHVPSLAEISSRHGEVYRPEPTAKMLESVFEGLKISTLEQENRVRGSRYLRECTEYCRSDGLLGAAGPTGAGSWWCPINVQPQPRQFGTLGILGTKHTLDESY